MNLPTLLSFSRIPLLFVVLGGLIAKSAAGATLALGAFGLALLTDWLDGLVARKRKEETALGALMDALIDKIFTLGLFIYCVAERLLPEWGLVLLVVMMARELLVTALRQAALLHGVVIAADKYGKVKTILQFLALALLILSAWVERVLGTAMGASASAEGLRLAGSVVFGLAGVLTVGSGVGYLWRYRSCWAVVPEGQKGRK